MKETPYELLKDIEKKQLGRNEEDKMTIYNALPRKRNSQVKNCKINLLTQEYEKLSISNEETIDSGFTRLNAIVTSFKSLDLDYSSKNHVRKFLCALSLKWRAKENIKSLTLKAKVNREQTSDDNDSQGGSDEDIDEEEAVAFNLSARIFRKFFRKGYFASECRKPKENKNFIGGAWSDSEDDDEHKNDATSLKAIDEVWLLEEIQVTWAQLEKKRTRPRFYTNSFEESAYSV
ncbi:hypothetical protein Tco_0943393 [Tanacetum coccineum]